MNEWTNKRSRLWSQGTQSSFKVQLSDSCRHGDWEKTASSPGVPLTVKQHASYFLLLADETELILPELKYRKNITFSQVVRSKMKQMLLCKGIVLKF